MLKPNESKNKRKMPRGFHICLSLDGELPQVVDMSLKMEGGKNISIVSIGKVNGKMIELPPSYNTFSMFQMLISEGVYINQKDMGNGKHRWLKRVDTNKIDSLKKGVKFTEK